MVVGLAVELGQHGDHILSAGLALVSVLGDHSVHTRPSVERGLELAVPAGHLQDLGFPLVRQFVDDPHPIHEVIVCKRILSER